MNEPKFVAHLKHKWNIKSNVDFLLIMAVFSLAGMMITFVRPAIFHFLKIDHSAWWIKTLVYIPLVPPLYQVGLLLFGFLLGQFEFFWEKEKRLAKFLLRSFSRPA